MPAPAASFGTVGAKPANQMQRLRGEKSTDASAADKATGAGKARRMPEEWVIEIRSLRRAGRESDAQAALGQLKLAYPDFPIPDDLKPQP